MTDCDHSWRLHQTSQWEYDSTSTRQVGEKTTIFGRKKTLWQHDVVSGYLRVDEFYCIRCRQFQTDYKEQRGLKPDWWSDLMSFPRVGMRPYEIPYPDDGVLLVK